jgi:lipid II:glycine glycyltransferase (peptidoglycan interpeptide bridge formation enzyme)
LVVDGDAGTGMAQVLINQRGPIGTAFIPRGPLVDGDQERVLAALWGEIEAACRRHHAINVTIEPMRPLRAWPVEHGPLVADSTQRYTPLRGVTVGLADEETIVAQMHASKRREVRRGRRRGIEIEQHGPDPAAIAAFQTVLEETGRRNGVRFSAPEHYRDFLQTFHEDGMLAFAIVDGEIAAGLIAGMAGEEATYLFGGSSTAHRVPGATALLQLAAMRWAWERGCVRYDLGGIPDSDPSSVALPDGESVRSRGSDDSGLFRFKVEFGGKIVTYPPSFEVRYQPMLWWVFRQMKSLNRARRAWGIR